MGKLREALLSFIVEGGWILRFPHKDTGLAVFSVGLAGVADAD
jgi:hypothetical protein